MKRRITLLLLMVSLLLTPAAQAAPEGAENFVRLKRYENQFSDLQPDSTFYANVSALYEYGLSVGKTDGTYGLKDSLTVGQAVIFAGRIRSLYRTGDPEAGPAAHKADGQLTAQPYLLYLQAEGVLDGALDHRLTAVATRAEMAHILANILPEKALPPLQDALVAEFYASGKFIQDVTAATPVRQDILKLYRCGISVGSDVVGSFLPEAPITRGATAAMLTRLVDPALRMVPQWDPMALHSAAGATLASLVPAGEAVTAPVTDAEMDSAIRTMLASDSNVLNLRYSGLTVEQAEKIMRQALVTVKRYCEQSYNSATCTFTQSGSVTLTFSAGGDGGQIAHYRKAAMEAAIAAHDYLWSTGALTSSMTEREKALVYFDWVCQAAVYDRAADDKSLSHIPYNLFAKGLAVCDGYTGAYNLLLKLEGISCSAVSLDSHIWTSAVLDGVEYHIDTTWGDNNGNTDYTYFAMTPEASWQAHKA